ncbi:histone H1-like [Heptranchias perlo]|uniref:histone H1-like n=1 Tax=Heptranchias perlo TaxID=212740 RepID=UPI003559540B
MSGRGTEQEPCVLKTESLTKPENEPIFSKTFILDCDTAGNVLLICGILISVINYFRDWLRTAETAPPAAAAAPPKAPKKKKAVPRPKSTGPPLGEQILKIVADCKDRKGISLAAIKKVLATKGLDVEKLRSQIKLSIKRNVEKGSLVQIKGTGASGSFRVAKKETQAKVVKKVKKQVTKKSPGKKPAAKKTAGKKLTAKKPAVKKSTTKKAAKSPIKKKAAAQKPKTPKTAKAKAKKVEKPRAKPKPKSAKPKKAAGKKK